MATLLHIHTELYTHTRHLIQKPINSLRSAQSPFISLHCSHSMHLCSIFHTDLIPIQDMHTLMTDSLLFIALTSSHYTWLVSFGRSLSGHSLQHLTDSNKTTFQCWLFPFKHCKTWTAPRNESTHFHHLRYSTRLFWFTSTVSSFITFESFTLHAALKWARASECVCVCPSNAFLINPLNRIRLHSFGWCFSLKRGKGEKWINEIWQNQETKTKIVRTVEKSHFKRNFVCVCVCVFL